MSSSLRIARVLPWAFLALCAWGAVAAAPETASPLGDLDFTLRAVRHDSEAYQTSTEKTAAAVALDKSDLKTETAVVQDGSKVQALLRARSIDPDGEALSAVYLLNPGVRNVSDLAPGTRLVLPAAPSGKLAPDALVQLTLVPETKRELAIAAQGIAARIEELDKLPDERVGTPSQRKEVVEALKKIRSYLGRVNTLVEKRERPLSPEMLAQSLAGARLVDEVLDGALRPGARWTAADRQAILGVSQDMALKALNLDEVRSSPMRWRDVQVVVSVVQLPGQKPVSDLRVFYAPEALIGKPFAHRSFPGFSPQVAKRLIEADYVFWAAAPGSSRPATEQVRQKVRRFGDDEVELQIAVLPSAEGGR